MWPYTGNQLLGDGEAAFRRCASAYYQEIIHVLKISAQFRSVNSWAECHLLNTSAMLKSVKAEHIKTHYYAATLNRIF